MLARRTTTLLLCFNAFRLITCSMTLPAYKSGSLSVVYVTTPTEEIATELARSVVNNKLAACVNIVPKVTSIYRWKDEMNEDQEVLMIMKTRTSKVPVLSDYIRENHPYEVAEVISTKVENGNPSYLSWVFSTVPEDYEPESKE